MVLQGPVGHMGQPSIESGSLPDREMDMQAETLQNLPRPSHGWEAKQGTSPCPPLSMSALGLPKGAPKRPEVPVIRVSVVTPRSKP